MACDGNIPANKLALACMQAASVRSYDAWVRKLKWCIYIGRCKGTTSIRL